MPGLSYLLARVRHVPEPLKRRLRPVYFRMLSTAVTAPGGKRAARVLARLMPGLHGWLRLRFDAYHVLRIVSPRSSLSSPEGHHLRPPAQMAAAESSVFRRLAGRQVINR